MKVLRVVVGKVLLKLRLDDMVSRSRMMRMVHELRSYIHYVYRCQ